MRLPTLMVLTVGLLIAADAPKDDAVKKELEKLQGTWKIVLVERAGKDAQKPDNAVVTISGSKFASKAGEKVVRAGTLKLDPSQKPKATDATYTVGPDKGQTLKGIYLLQGDTWKIHYNGPDMERPKKFSDKAYLILVLKREKS